MTDRLANQIPRTAEQWAAINAAKVAHECSPVHIQHLLQGALDAIARLTGERNEARALADHAEKRHWHDGEPPKPQRDEWFIAETIYGDRVCLKALPEDWTYDYKTADETYIMARNIKRWMRFPDSHFIEPAPGAAEARVASLEGADLQLRVAPWMQACFGPEISADAVERRHRFIEEALELLQAMGGTKHEAAQLVDYVFEREKGTPHQEVGGVMITLAALCLAAGLDMHKAGEDELARIWTKVDAIRAKQAAKPKHSVLPIAGAQLGAQP